MELLPNLSECIYLIIFIFYIYLIEVILLCFILFQLVHHVINCITSGWIMAGLGWEPEVTWLTSIPLWRCWVGPGWQESLVHAGPGVCSRWSRKGNMPGHEIFWDPCVFMGFGFSLRLLSCWNEVEAFWFVSCWSCRVWLCDLASPDYSSSCLTWNLVAGI